MSIQIDTVRIAGFRALSNIELTLPRVTVLIGQNNSGKTSVIKALQLALGDYFRFLSDEDFHIDENEIRTDVITVDIRFVSVENEKRIDEFSESWQQSFGDKIQAEADGKQFVGLRTTASFDKVKGGYKIDRYHLENWPNPKDWIQEKVHSKNRIGRRLQATPFISIDAQRDIHQDLKEKSSFIGRVLTSIEYNQEDVSKLEKMIKDINHHAIEKSEPLKGLKQHLDTLSQSFEGPGKTELTPFPKKIRDLSKRFSIHFGESDKSSFSMEYHGMGTRSWASMLTVKAFTELIAKNHEDEFEAFFPFIAAEEPEAHLHPNSQRTLFEQLQESSGQVIVSTHSPYLAAMCHLKDLRGLLRTGSKVQPSQLMDGLDSEDINKLQREVMRTRGELLFSKALLLFEGVTEEQIIPAMFQLYFGKSCFSLGISFAGVGGKNYPPFIKIAACFGIPVCIISDNDQNTKTEVQEQIKNFTDKAPPNIDKTKIQAFFLSASNDIENELVRKLDMREEIITSLFEAKAKGNSNTQYREQKIKELQSKDNSQLVYIMQSSKASYAGFLASIISRNPNNKTPEKLIPKAVISAFEQLKHWGKL